MKIGPSRSSPKAPGGHTTLVLACPGSFYGSVSGTFSMRRMFSGATESSRYAWGRLVSVSGPGRVSARLLLALATGRVPLSST